MFTTSGNAPAVTREFIESSRTFLKTDYWPKLRQCLEQMSEEDIWWRPNDASNSVGNLVLHLSGNITQWIVGGVGKQSVFRNRPAEFSAKGPMPKKELIDRLKQTLEAADAVLAEIAEDS